MEIFLTEAERNWIWKQAKGALDENVWRPGDNAAEMVRGLLGKVFDPVSMRDVR